ncbi:hypothetical protein [Leisingera sp. S232]|uniref:hypothetical protein n=1 Tax=Leisingera sp. S232 TaxID=3415132 RepID=UPI003C7D8412
MDGYVLDTKTDEGRYLLLLRLGREPAEWAETTALRYWFESIHNMAFLATFCCALAWAVVYYLWREWRKSQGKSTELD